MVKDKKSVFLSVIRAIVIVLIVFLFILPLWIIFTGSLTDEWVFRYDGYSMIIKQFSLDGYKLFFAQSKVMKSLLNTVIVSAVTVLISTSVHLLTAYALHVKDMPMHKFFNTLFVVTMFFSAGTIPSYLVVCRLGLYGNVFSIILPGALSVYCILLIRNYFYSVPRAMTEAAVIDGANHFRILFQVLIPVSVPVIVTTVFICFVSKWNSWMDVMLYLDGKEDLYTIQYTLRKLFTQIEKYLSLGDEQPLYTLKNAATVISILPLVLMFPFFQKYFTNGIMVGSVKG